MKTYYYGGQSIEEDTNANETPIFALVVISIGVLVKGQRSKWSEDRHYILLIYDLGLQFLSN